MIKKILVADDEVDIVAGIETILTDSHYQVITAHNGDIAWDKVKSEQPDLVIMDVLLPGMTGYHLMKEMRENPGPYSQIPFIIMSGKSSMKDCFGVFANTDYDHFLDKPFRLEDLLEIVEKAIGRSED